MSPNTTPSAVRARNHVLRLCEGSAERAWPRVVGGADVAARTETSIGASPPARLEAASGCGSVLPCKIRFIKERIAGGSGGDLVVDCRGFHQTGPPRVHNEFKLACPCFAMVCPELVRVTDGFLRDRDRR